MQVCLQRLCLFMGRFIGMSATPEMSGIDILPKGLMCLRYVENNKEGLNEYY